MAASSIERHPDEHADAVPEQAPPVLLA